MQDVLATSTKVEALELAPEK